MNSDAATPPALSLVADPRLRDEIRRIAAAADRPLEERVPAPGRHAWTSASAIVLDTAAARSCASAEHPRRAGILLVTDGEPSLLDWQAATAVGAELVLSLPADADALVAAFAAHDGRRPGDGAVLAVAGAGAGAGASVLATAVALTAAGRFRDRTLLVDCAPFGGGLDLLLGLENSPGLRWPDLSIEHGRVSAPALHAALPATSGLALLSCGRGVDTSIGGTQSPTTDLDTSEGARDQRDTLAPGFDRSASCLVDRGATVSAFEAPGASGCTLAPAAVRAVIEGGRAAGDLVVADLSSEHGPHTEQVLDIADLVVLVTQARVRSVAAAKSAAAYCRTRNPNVRVVVRGPAPGGLMAGDIAEALSLPLLASVPSQPGLAERLERGGLTVRRRGPLRTAAETCLTALFSDGPAQRQAAAQPGPGWWRVARSRGAYCAPVSEPAGVRK
ncbi:septum site-determining protein Ssd [Nocardia sp. NPDC059240]|uniref:septum site-determining protein Ssd n=1 Tax=Nocardia sp. NPDC059240 TaxID=3346786 RepID=UPI0036BCD8DB